MSYNVVFLYIKDFWLNFIFETLDDKKNNQKIDQKHKRRFLWRSFFPIFFFFKFYGFFNLGGIFNEKFEKHFYQKILIVWLLERA